MSKENTKQLLKALHQELNSSKTAMDGELKHLLYDVENDIVALLNAEEKDDSLTEGSKPSSKVDDLITKFAADHPRTEGILQELAEALHKMGI